MVPDIRVKIHITAVLSAAALMMFSIFICYKSLHLGIGTFSMPGPGFFPLGCGLVMGGFAILEVLVSLRGRVKQQPQVFSKNVCFTIAVMLLWAVMLERLGFMFCTFMFIALLAKRVGNQPVPIALLLSVAITACLKIVFDVAFRANLPTGILF